MSNTDTTIEVDDEDAVSVDVSDAPELAEAAAAAAAAGEKPDPVPAAAGMEEADVTAQAVLQEALDKTRKALEASDATALAERKRAEEATRLAASREVEARTSHETIQQREAELLDSQIESTQRDLETSQKELSDAMEAGDFKLVASANAKIAKAAARADRLEASKADLEAGKTRKTTPAEGRVEAVQPTEVSAFEQYVGQYAPAAQTWLRNHRDCLPAEVGGNPVKNAKMMQGHYAALAQGLTPNSAEYFDVIEKSITDAPIAPAPKPKPRQAQPSAPVSREPPSNNGTPNRRSVTLSREQQEVARMSFPDKKPNEAYALYARNLLDLQAEGKLGRATH